MYLELVQWFFYSKQIAEQGASGPDVQKTNKYLHNNTFYFEPSYGTQNSILQ
jgi:hypothetical protein